MATNFRGEISEIGLPIFIRRIGIRKWIRISQRMGALLGLAAMIDLHCVSI